MAGIVVLIPAFNEADLVGETVKAALAMPGVGDVIVIDDGSEDDTASVAEAAGARVMRMGRNQGKGAALSAGLAETESDIVLMIDADLGASAVETHRLLEPVFADEADMSIAVMEAPAGHKAGFGLARGLAAWGIKRYGGMEVSAPLSGQRAVRRKLLEEIGGFETGFGVETALTIDALRKGYRIVEVPLPLRHRLTGRNWRGIVHRARQFADIARAIWRRR